MAGNDWARELTLWRPTFWLPATASLRAVRQPGTGRVRLTITDGDAAVSLVLSAAQTEETCRQLLDGRPWSPSWWEVYGR